MILRNLVSVLIICLFVRIPLFGKQEDQKREFDREAIAAYKDSPKFDYSKEYAQSGSFLALILYYIFDKITSFFGATGIGWLTPYVFRILIVAVILGLIYYLVRSRYGPVFFRDRSGYSPAGIVSLTDEKVDYTQLINESVEKSEYRLAIRYLFLRSLSLLHDSGALQIRQWKTPYDYLYEISQEKQLFFQELIQLFEVTWYGDYDATKVIFDQGLEISKKLIR